MTSDATQKNSPAAAASAAGKSEIPGFRFDPCSDRFSEDGCQFNAASQCSRDGAQNELRWRRSFSGLQLASLLELQCAKIVQH